MENYSMAFRVSLFTLMVLFIVPAVLAQITPLDNTLYVDQSINQSGDGSSWGEALKELADALKWTREQTDDGHGWDEEHPLQIWVAKGTYFPLYNAADGNYDEDGGRDNAFVLVPNVHLYGGFENGDPFENRDWEANETILSGDIGVESDPSDNTFHVLVYAAGSGHSVMDGFTITGGTADGNDDDGEIFINGVKINRNHGGGLYTFNSSIILTNLLFEYNFAEQSGGGAYISESGSRAGILHPAVRNVLFRDNESNLSGGGLALHRSDSQITGVIFENNKTGRYGGGLFTSGLNGALSHPVLKNVIFRENISVPSTNLGTSGAGMATQYSSPVVYNALFTKNISSHSGGAIDHALNGTLTMYNVTIAGNEAERIYGGGIYNRNGAKLNIHNSIIWGNSAGFAESPGNEVWIAPGNFAEFHYSLVSGGEGDIVTGGEAVANYTLYTNPQFKNSAAGDFSLAGNSPAINAGDPNTDLSEFIINSTTQNPVDLAQNPRLFDGNVGIIDIGAYEFQGDPVISGPDFKPFVTTWKTDNPGESDDRSISIPMKAGGYGFTIDWGDGTTENYNANEGNDVLHYLSHTYPVAGVYEVKIRGDFPRIAFNNLGDKDKILEVKQWGDIEWSSMEYAFYGASNLNVTAADAPDLSNVTSMKEMFRNASSFNGEIGHWNTETIVSMESMFQEATAFNQSIGNLDVSLVETTAGMFMDAEAFDQDLGNWNIGSIEAMEEMFDNSGMSVQNYDATITGWSSYVVTNHEPKNIELGAAGLAYCTSIDARNSLIGNHGWAISGDSVAGDCGTLQIFTEVTLSDTEGWRMLSLPDQSQTLGDFFGDFANHAAFNLFTFDQTAYDWDDESVSLNTIPGPGNAFIVYAFEEDLPRTLKAAGDWILPNGTFQYSDLGYDENSTDNYYLLGNPHPFVLDYCKMTGTSQHLNHSIWFWDPATGYADFNCSVDDEVFIAPYQAFWVYTTGASPQLGVPEEAYSNRPPEGYFKEGNQQDEERLLLTLRVENMQTDLVSSARILFSPDASETMGVMDTPHLSSSGLLQNWISFYSVGEDQNRYSLQALPESYALSQNYPNPFNPATIISYELPQAGQVRLDVYDMTGRQITTLVNREMSAGHHQITFDASHLSSGIYMYRLHAGGQMITRRLTVLK